MPLDAFIVDGHLAVVARTAQDLADLEAIGLQVGGDWIPLVRQDEIRTTGPNAGLSRFSHLQAGGVMPMPPGAASAPEIKAAADKKGEPAYRKPKAGEQAALEQAVAQAKPQQPIEPFAPVVR